MILSSNLTSLSAPRSGHLRSLILAVFILVGAGSAPAQAAVDPAACWAASAPATLTVAQTCQAHPGCAIVLARSASCETSKVWLDRLAPLLAAQGRITNSDVITAGMPVLRPIPGLIQKVDGVRRRVASVYLNGGGAGVMLRTKTGTPMYYEGAMQDGLPQGMGAMISGSGGMTRGNYVGGLLNGDGQTLDSKGSVFVGSMWDGHLKGDGAFQLPDGLVMVGYFENYQPNSLTETFYPDGRSQKAFFSEPGKLLTAGSMAAPGVTAKDPDTDLVMKYISLRLDCAGQAPLVAVDALEHVKLLRELVRGPCGADAETLKNLVEAEKDAGLAASQERQRAMQQAAAKAQADSERTAMFSSFFGQVSSILGSFQAGQQMAVAEAAATAAASPPPAQMAAPATSSASRASEAPAREPAGRSRWVHNPAADARSCVQMVQTSASTTARISGNFTFRNGCNSNVEVFWCFPRAGGGCSGGGTWTIGAGRGWPVMDNEASIVWSACRGANGGGWDRDVAPGTRYTCHLLQW